MSTQELPPIDLASLLTVLGDAVSNEVVGALEGTGLRHGHGYFVQRLLLGPATATEMAAELGITQQAVSRTVKELLALGHVEPTVDIADSRRRPVRLTAQGLAAVEGARSVRQQLGNRIRDGLGDRRHDRLVADLEEVLDVLGLRDQVSRRAVRPPKDGLD